MDNLNETEIIKNKSWFALYTKPRHEFKAAAYLKEVDIEYFLPTVTKVRQWSDRKKKIEEPILRGYIFISADERDRVRALEFESIIRCLFEHGRPAIIPDWQIVNLKNFLSKETDFFVNNGLLPGVKVMIKDGPFTGVIGTILEADNQKSISVSIDLLNRAVIARLAEDTLFEIVKEVPKQEENKAFYYAAVDEVEAPEKDTIESDTADETETKTVAEEEPEQTEKPVNQADSSEKEAESSDS